MGSILSIAWNILSADDFALLKVGWSLLSGAIGI